MARASVRLTYDFLAFENSPVTTRRPIFTRTLRQVHHDSEIDVPLPERDETIETVEYTDGFGRLLQTRSQGEDMRFGDPIFGGQVLPKDELPAGNDVVGVANTDTTKPNVIVSGWQTYDNKGRVVEKYQPFFSTGWDYAAALSQQLGQKSTLIHDPRGQLIRTINSDGSEQRVVYGVPADLANPNVFSPSLWEAYTYDSNDNAGRTPSADPNASSYEHHWNTPSSVVVDALGRTIVTVGRNRAKRTAGNPLTPVEEIRSRSTYDIQGNLLTITDELGRLAFRYSYDLIKRTLRTENIDAGVKLVVVDAPGNPVEQRDSKGAIILRTYDLLNRAVRLWAQDGINQPLTLREKLIYGDSLESGLTEAQARDLNLSGKLYRHFDEAGLTTIGAYDCKGNVLESTRQVINDAALLSAFNSPPANWQIQAFRVNWDSPASVLDQTEYQTSYTYDALNRLKKIVYPKDVDFATTAARKALKPRYNRAGALESVELDGAVFVERIAYNARGQRAFIAYGNNCFTRYAYDDKTFRLVRLRTEKYTKLDKNTYRPGNPVLQDFVYTYDLAGNILLIKDRTPSSGIPNTVIGINKLDRTFTYDPLYRLLSATGRESDLQPQSAPWIDSPQAQDPTKTRAYQQTYTYDAGSNMTRLHHESTSVIFNRDFTFVPGANRLANVTDTGVTRAYAYDVNGNLIRENTERNFEWDHSDRMRVYRNQIPNTAPSLHTQYLYNSGGQRVKKLVRTGANDYFVTTYIDGIFEHHRRVKPTGTQENNTLHIMDDQSRIATVRVGAAFPDDGAANVPVKYHLGDHLGSSNVVLDASGSLVNREEFAPYGETSFGSFAKKRYRFTGKERDEESGLSYHGARYYAPWLSRWVSCDPAGTVDGPNLLQYCKSNPINGKDVTGLAEGDDGEEAPSPAQPVQPAQGDRYGRDKGFLGWFFKFFGFQKAERLETEVTDETSEKYYEARDVRAKGVEAAGEVGLATGETVMMAMPGPQGGEAEAEAGARGLVTREKPPESVIVAPVEDTVKAVEQPAAGAAKRWEDFLPQARKTVKGKAEEYSNVYAEGQLHHIATNKGDPEGWQKLNREIFEEAGVSLDKDKANLIEMANHRTNHPQAYHMYIWLRLKAATAGLRSGAYKEALIAELKALQEELKKVPELIEHDYWKKLIGSPAPAK